MLDHRARGAALDHLVLATPDLAETVADFTARTGLGDDTASHEQAFAADAAAGPAGDASGPRRYARRSPHCAPTGTSTSASW